MTCEQPHHTQTFARMVTTVLATGVCMSTNKQLVHLNSEQLVTIKKWSYDHTKSATYNFELFMVAVYKEACGVDIREEGAKLDPTAFAIPKEQWQTLISWLLENSPVDVRPSWAMNWVSYSPSAY